MCRQAIRLAVVRKFKDEYDLDIETFNDLYVFVSKFNKTDKILEFNNLINDLKLCDPAVGSGHFLVSALNEILAIKSELGIFASDDGKPFNQYAIKIANDEIIVTDRENKEFRYVMRDGKPLNDEMQNLQKTLFHEKQTLIENCLFGVDINPNSVKICRLRLWIELLKNAYYKEADNFRELETLPNIDINIKKGNSLLSRFALDADLKEALKTIKYSVKDYQSFVQGYKETRDRETKRDFEAKIKLIKDDFKVQLNHLSPERIKLADLNNQLKASESRQYLFGESDADKAARFKKEEKLRADIEKQNEKIRAIENNAIYKNAFEWRFEFPEVLDNDGNFLGFDIVIGNPPYISALELKKSLSEDAYRQLKLDYKTAKGTVDLFIYFFEKGLMILKSNMNLMYITPNRYLSASYGEALREFLFDSTTINEIVDYSDVRVFEEAGTYPIVSSLSKRNQVGKIYEISIGKYDVATEEISFKQVNSEKLNFLESYIWGYLLNDKIK
jgi:type II restriction/modification system DNA methylase subunit YeeA